MQAAQRGTCNRKTTLAIGYSQIVLKHCCKASVIEEQALRFKPLRSDIPFLGVNKIRH